MKQRLKDIGQEPWPRDKQTPEALAAQQKIRNRDMVADHQGQQYQGRMTLSREERDEDFAFGARGDASCCSAGAQAQSDYPNKPVKIIIDSAPGSATDVAARLMAERLGKVWGQQAVVDNRPGAGGSIAVRAASQAAPDGYTLYVGAASTFTALKGAPGVAPNLPIELPRDFTPIGFITQQPMFIAVVADDRRQVAAGADRARQEEARRIVLRHHRARTDHASDHGASAGARRHQAADDPLQPAARPRRWPTSAPGGSPS